ncbi:sulfate adenylyltransferase subunit CysN [Thalassotalea sp. LPB0316]|uniref:sulfate adenylyltransferase subunit CysN n=1 Tax=Thalassotalea sp. LPB0316 TaxID=2769490 RepID=UPI0018683438|nr:sulfate adenylyltransferase subunit CysN [Thalassotalea sp. LPB0316]QOL24428.1 sulfate adenylyltransferase subunit CysN [Thalassotalea sp. LPB0316]
MSHQSELIDTDIIGYLKQHEEKELVRFLTCGSVDDGKSTLIGRLLHDSKMIFEDQLAAIEKDSVKSGTTGETVDLALLVDGLQSEREQGITIDVAYRYFSTEKRKFIIADTPGHEQYTRNMATGASTCDLAIILVDARHGIQTQTRRHSFICSLLGIKHVLVAVNKMDLVDYSQDVYQTIKKEYREFADSLNFTDVRFVPISALKGDNVVEESSNMSWYPGSTLMKLLNAINVDAEEEFAEFRLPVQYVNRPNLNFRGFAGTVASGHVRVGDTIVALPSGKESKVKSIVTFDGEAETADKGMAITLTLEDEIDISRGEMIVRKDMLPHSSKNISATVVWMHEDALELGREYYIKQGSKLTTGFVSKFNHKINVNTLETSDTQELGLNEIGQASFAMAEELHFDAYQQNRFTGSFIVIDRLTNITVGAGMIDTIGEGASEQQISQFELEFNALVRKHFPHWGARDIGKLLGQ